MSITKLIKLCGATLLSGMLAGVSLTAQAAEENLYTGTACMTTSSDRNNRVKLFMTCNVMMWCVKSEY